MSSEDLYSEAVEAARAGNRELAREKLERLIEVDEENIKAWLLLARVSDTYEERRICLTTVLQLDPNNQKAKEMLAKLEERQAEREVDEVIPGISRRTFTMFAGGVAVIVILGIIIVTAVIISNNRAETSRNRDATRQAQTATAFPAIQTQGAIDATQTQIAIASPTPTATSTSELPPTATPTATATGEPTLAPPMNLPGRLYGWSGFDVLSVDFLPVVQYDLTSGGEPQQLFGDTLGRYVTSANGERIIFVQYRQSLNDQLIVEGDLTQTIGDQYAISNLSFLWSTTEILDDPDMVSVAPDGSFIVFTAGIAATGSRELILFDLPTAFTDTEEAEAAGEGEATPEVTGNPPVVRLTNDTANYSYPVISPDGSQIAVVRTLTEGDNPGTDIVIIDIASRTQRELTTDRDAVMETMLRWHPNGQEIIYAYNTPDNRNHNIGAVAIDGSGLSYNISANPEEDQIFPVMSPDARYLAYSSNRGTGITYDLYIVDLTTNELFQATNSLREDDFARMWLP